MSGLIARLRLSPASPRVPTTTRDLLARLGRTLLWLLVIVLLVRGLGAVLDRPRPAPAVRIAYSAAAAWPDDAARAFAVEFATAYLTHSPTVSPDAYASSLQAYASPDLVAELLPRFDPRAPAEGVRSATVAGAVRLDDRHALVTVAAALDGPTATRRLVVPVERDAHDGLVVDDLPSFAPAEARAASTATETEPLFGPDRAAIANVVTPFMRAYLDGDTAGLSYLEPPGTHIAAAGELQLVELTGLSSAGPASKAGRTVLVGLQARDTASRAVYALRYRVRLARRDRWYVADLNASGSTTR